MDMSEDFGDENSSRQQKILSFKCVESSMFSAFEGTWAMRYHTRHRKLNEKTKQYTYTYSTLLTYTVLVKPKGIVPVMALEWRIREDVPPNLKAVKIAAEKLLLQKNMYNNANSNTLVSNNALASSSSVPVLDPLKSLRLVNSNNWASDETLGMYIAASRNSSVK